MWAEIGIPEFLRAVWASRPSRPGVRRRTFSPSPVAWMVAAWAVAAAASALLVVACGAPPWRLAAGAVTFARGEVRVELPAGHPLQRVELREAGGARLLAQPVTPGQPGAVRFRYSWRPAERLQLAGVGAEQHPAPLALTAPMALPPSVRVGLELPAGVPLPQDGAPLVLPAGAEGVLALIVTNLGDEAGGGTGQVAVKLSLPPWLGAASSAQVAAAEPPRFHVFDGLLPGESGRWELPFRVDSGAAAGTLHWEVTGGGLGAPLAGERRLLVAGAAAWGPGLRIARSEYPADAAGKALTHQVADRITLLPAWAEALGRWWGSAAPRDPYLPWSHAGVTLTNGMAGAVVVLVRTSVRLATEGPSAPGFGDPLLRGGDGAAASLVLLPAGGEARVAQPVYFDPTRGAPGRYIRCTEARPWGLPGSGGEQCVPFRVAVSGLGGALALWGGTALALAGLLAGLATMGRWMGAFPLRDLILIALMAGSAFLLVSVPGFLLRSLTAFLLGPFAFLLEGLLFKALLFLLLGCLFAVVRRPGVFFLFYGLWAVAQALLSGHTSPVTVLFAGVTVGLIEGALWLSGLTRPAAPAARVPWLAGALIVGLAEGLAVFWGLHLIMALFRVYLADWFVAIQAVTEGLYAAGGLALGLRLGARLATARRPAVASGARGGAPLGPRGAAAPEDQGGEAPPVPATPALEVRGLTFGFAGAAAPPLLRDVTLRLLPGEVVVVGGASGSGKTTLLRLVQGLLPWPTGAELRAGGTDGLALDPKAWARRCGLLFQEPALQVVRQTVAGEVAFGREVTAGGADGPAVGEALRRFGLEPLAARHPATLSGGELQRTALASLWATGARVLLLDEPLAHLDGSGRALLVEQLRALTAGGAAVVIAEHRLAPLLDLADQVVWLPGPGAPPWRGTPAQFRRTAMARAPEPAPVPALPVPPGDSQGGVAPAHPACPWAELTGVSFRHRGAAAPLMGDLSAELAPGRAVALTGPNGAGKSTLFALLLGQARPEAGTVRVRGRPAHRLGRAARARLLGYLPQQAELLLQAPSAADELAFSLRWRPGSDLDSGRAALAVEQWLGLLGLEGQGHLPPHLLSRGERRRLALGAVLAGAPRVVLLDEPFAGQDPRQAAAIVALCRGFLALGGGRSLVIATHDLEPALSLCDETLRLEGGRLNCTRMAAGTDAAGARTGARPDPPVAKRAAGGGA